EHDVAARRRVVHACRHADFVLLGSVFRMYARTTEQLAHLIGVDHSVLDHLRVAAGDSARDFPRDRADLSLELTNARLTRVLADDGGHGVVGELDLFVAKPRLLELPR